MLQSRRAVSLGVPYVDDVTIVTIDSLLLSVCSGVVDCSIVYDSVKLDCFKLSLILYIKQFNKTLIIFQ